MPGLLRIVQAMDGGICRVKLDGGSMTALQARAVADVAQRYASGVIDATHLRGTARRVALDEEQLVARDVLGLAVGQLAGQHRDARALALC